MKQNVDADADADDGRIYRVIVNDGIRWNCSCDMIEGVMKLRDALETSDWSTKALTKHAKLKVAV